MKYIVLLVLNCVHKVDEENLIIKLLDSFNI